MNRMEPDGRTQVIYTPDTAAGIRALAEALKKLGEALGETPTFDIPYKVPRPSNERPWHRHTLPNRKRRK